MKALHPEVQAKYALVGIRPGKYNFKGFGEIDLCTLTIQKADSLVARGFPHLKIRTGGGSPQPTDQNNLKARPIGVTKSQKEEPPAGAPAEQLRKNKQYVNKLLTLNFNDLSYQDKLVFFNDELYFLEKKKLFLEISEADREMKTLHAKIKNIPKDPKNDGKRKGIMQKLSDLDELKTEHWVKIDTWQEPAATDPEKIKEQAAKDALAKEKLIKANENYIYRAELSIPKMKEETPADKKRKQEKMAEVARRKKELEDMGVPYNRKSRK